MRVVLPESAELATFRLRRTWAALDSRRDSTQLSPDRGRIGAQAGLTLDRQDAGSAVVQLLAVTEAHFSEAFHAYGSDMAVAPRYAERVVDRSRTDVERSWDHLAQAWKAWHGVNVRASADWETLRTFIEVRNSLLHGDGRLTRRQAKSPDSRKTLVNKMTSVGVAMRGDRLLISVSVAERSFVTCVSFVTWLGWTSLSEPTG